MGVKQYNDAEIISAYYQYRSEDKVAEIIGCGHTTVWRILKKAGIPRDGWKHKGNGGGGDKPKITDAELIAESRTMSRMEIARKHNMCVCNVDRKARRLGIKCANGVGAGGHWRERANAYNITEYDETITLDAVYKKYNGVCQICGRKTDYFSKSNRHIRRDYPTVDHIVPLSRGGTHTWDNVQLAHMGCNAGKCDKVC